MASSKYVGISGGCIQEVVDYEFGTYVEGQNFFDDCGPIDEEDGTINEQQLLGNSTTVNIGYSQKRRANIIGLSITGKVVL